MRLDCPVCDRRVSGYVPKGGDGSGLRPNRHKNADGAWCDGTYQVVWTSRRRGEHRAHLARARHDRMDEVRWTR